MEQHTNNTDDDDQQQQQQQQQTITMDHQQQDYSPIIKFYKNRSVFITGGSGFMGKVLIEKLLRSCIGIDKIYILLRHKRNRQPKERLNDLVNSSLFGLVRLSSSQLLDKIIVVEGDVTMTKLGLSEQDFNKLIQDVSVVFHSAATIKFDEPLKQSVAINVTGTKNIIDLCRKLPKLSALVHVSTAYANCDKPIIDERIYPMEEAPEKLIDLSEWMDEDIMQSLKIKLLRKRPNTYTYTKALAEALLLKQASDLPVIICRPSIVVASWREPFRGWIDNVNGPTGILLACGKGLVRSMLADKNCRSDIIPVDTVINLMVTLGWYAAKNYQSVKTTVDDKQQLVQQKKQIPSPLLNEKEVRLSWDLQEVQTQVEDNQHHQQQDFENDSLDELNNNDQTLGNNNNNNHCSTTTNSMMNSSGLRKNIAKNVQQKLKQQQQQPPQGAKVDDGYGSASATPDIKEYPTTDCNSLVMATNNNMVMRDGYSGRIERSNSYTIPVFHCTSGVLNPISWKTIQEFVILMVRLYPSIQVFRYPNGSFEHRRYIDTFYRITLHYIPAYILDCITRLSGGKPIMVRIFQKFDQAALVLSAFTTSEWIFKSDNIKKLQNEMSPYDRKTFHCDIRHLHWGTYFLDYVLGVRKYLLKESPATLTQARKNLNKTYYRNLILQVLVIAALIYYVVSPSTIMGYMDIILRQQQKTTTPSYHEAVSTPSQDRLVASVCLV